MAKRLFFESDILKTDRKTLEKMIDVQKKFAKESKIGEKARYVAEYFGKLVKYSEKNSESDFSGGISCASKKVIYNGNKIKIILVSEMYSTKSGTKYTTIKIPDLTFLGIPLSYRTVYDEKMSVSEPDKLTINICRDTEFTRPLMDLYETMEKKKETAALEEKQREENLSIKAKKEMISNFGLEDKIGAAENADI